MMLRTRTSTADVDAAEALRRAQRRTGADLTGRLRLLLGALGAPAPAPGADLATVAAAAVDALADDVPGATWLTLAVVSGSLPEPEQLVAVRRAAAIDGPSRALVAAAERVTRRTARRRVRVLTGATVVDLGDLVQSPLGTGIQRVARNVTAEWLVRHDPVVVAWTPEFDALRVVGEAELEATLRFEAAHDDVAGTDGADGADGTGPEVVVPWGCTYVLPELAVQPTRCAAMQAMAAHSTNRTGVIGFDCVPITSAETTAHGFAGVFSLNLAAVAHFDTVCAISDAAAAEYEGWRRMLEGAGLTGPAITAVGLPGHAPEPEPEAVLEAQRRLLLPGLPLVLVVGSHEPRKNHLSVLHAAEQLWRRGRRFSLTFIGGNAWGSEEFTERLAELQRRGRPVESVSKLPDRLLWAAYRLARCTVFPSLNEGFGLPVAESLSAGTPAITSNFGSMREIAEEGGALMVDPRDDADLVAALDRVLTDDALLARLRTETAARPVRGWDDYAERVWSAVHA
jgi:glycosyltransferase involved in cell wall biosynthesis